MDQNLSQQPQAQAPNVSSIMSRDVTGDAANLSVSTRNLSINSSFKEQKKSYHQRKKYFTKNIQSAIESTQEIHSGWLKARTTFKRWTKVWCQIKPSYLILYTSQEAQKKHRFGVVLLSVCQIIIRPTKKEGFCFKLLNPFDCSVWALSSTRAFVFPQSSLTLRASDESVGKIWVDALHQCNLSANLEGYQPVNEDSARMIEGSKCNKSELSDSDDDGDSSTRQLESILGRQSNSDSNSLASVNTNNNNISTINNNNNSRLLGPNRSNMNGGRVPQSTPGFNRFGTDLSMNSTFKSINDDFNMQEKKTSNYASQLGNNTIDRVNNFNNQQRQQKSTNSNANASSAAHNYAINQAPSGHTNSSKMVAKFSKYTWRELQLESVNYLADEGAEVLGSAGAQNEEVHESNKNFLWHIIKQLRPGMDLSKVTLPTFILEPRSFLEKLADYYYHCDILSDAVLIDDPLMRFVNIVKWYLSGFYKKPDGTKKPYNPILGEKFRCFWDHPKTQSRTFFIAEQVSHHPPVSAFHVSNRKDGYIITCSPLTRSRFGGNSVSAILDGKAKLHLIRRNETYTVTLPYAHCRGILLGTLSLELGGKVNIECAETGCKCELDFKLAPVWASSSSYNSITGRILRSNKITHTLEGHWDKKINIVDKRNEEKSVLWEVTDSVRSSRLKRYTVDLKDQGDRESVKLWKKVSEALAVSDQTVATTEKTRLEDMQRQEARDRSGVFAPDHFECKSGTNEWTYRWQDSRPWDESRDIVQFEENFQVKTLVVDSSRLAAQQQDTQSGALDLPLNRLSRFSTMVDRGTRNSMAAGGSDNQGNSQGNVVNNIQSTFDAKSQLFEQAIKQVTERSKKLEEDVANLKRGKKTVALVMTAIIVALLSAFFTYFS